MLFAIAIYCTNCTISLAFDLRLHHRAYKGVVLRFWLHSFQFTGVFVVRDTYTHRLSDCHGLSVFWSVGTPTYLESEGATEGESERVRARERESKRGRAREGERERRGKRCKVKTICAGGALKYMCVCFGDWGLPKFCRNSEILLQGFRAASLVSSCLRVFITCILLVCLSVWNVRERGRKIKCTSEREKGNKRLHAKEDSQGMKSKWKRDKGDRVRERESVKECKRTREYVSMFFARVFIHV